MNCLGGYSTQFGVSFYNAAVVATADDSQNNRIIKVEPIKDDDVKTVWGSTDDWVRVGCVGLGCGLCLIPIIMTNYPRQDVSLLLVTAYLVSALFPAIIARMFSREALKYHAAEHMVIAVQAAKLPMTLRNVEQAPRAVLGCSTVRLGKEMVWFTLMFLLTFTQLPPIFVSWCIIAATTTVHSDWGVLEIIPEGFSLILQQTLTTIKPDEKHITNAIAAMEAFQSHPSSQEDTK